LPRILVADDNSNIQKMVALAFKDQGVEVVGVGNGEAAVRKVPEINPDVILADVFMPVRSGYEVCEFVKNDSRYMHTPVVLLVGAFDPLDEHEAQRVRADGVLKKPFVPPEPLINLVKALLVKSASERLVAVAAPAASTSASAEAAHPKTAPATHEHDFVDEPTEELVAPAPVVALPGSKSAGYESPVAFGSLLATPAEELPALDETDPIVTSSRDPSLGDPVFWSHQPPAAKEVEAETAVEAEDATEHSWGHNESLNKAAEIELLDEPIELDYEAARTRSLEAAQEEAEAISVAPTVESTIEATFATIEVTPEAEAAQEAPEQATVSIEPAKQEAATPETAKPETGEEDTLALEMPSEVSDFAEFELAPVPTIIEWPHPEDSLPAAIPAASAEPVKSAAPAPIIAAGPDPALEPPIGSETPVVSASVDPILESTAEQAAELQANWHPALEAVAEVAPEAAAEKPAAAPEGIEEEEQEVATSWPPAFRPVTVPAEPVKAAWAPKFAEVQPLSKETMPVASAVVSRATEAPAGLPRAAEAIANVAADLTKSTVKEAAASGTLDPEVVEAVVTRIVERMQPKIMELVTREILRPVVEALVRREVEKS
jgi:CheY-like chemotaxis protein